jgi:hypothetical protein
VNSCTARAASEGGGTTVAEATGEAGEGDPALPLPLPPRRCEGTGPGGGDVEAVVEAVVAAAVGPSLAPAIREAGGGGRRGATVGD